MTHGVLDQISAPSDESAEVPSLPAPVFDAPGDNRFTKGLLIALVPSLAMWGGIIWALRSWLG